MENKLGDLSVFYVIRNSGSAKHVHLVHLIGEPYERVFSLDHVGAGGFIVYGSAAISVIHHYPHVFEEWYSIVEECLELNYPRCEWIFRYPRLRELSVWLKYSALVAIKLMHDVEPNPGPDKDLSLMEEDLDLMFRIQSMSDEERLDPQVYQEILDRLNEATGLRLQFLTILLFLVCPDRAQVFGLGGFSLDAETMRVVTRGVAAMENFNKIVPDTVVKAKDLTHITIHSSADDILEGITSLMGLNVSPEMRTALPFFVMLVLLFLRRRYPTSGAINTLCVVVGLWGIVRNGVPILSKIVQSWVTPVPQTGPDDIVDIAVEAISLGLFAKSAKFDSLDKFGDSMVQIDRHSKGLSNYLTRLKEWIIKVVTSIAELFGVELNMHYSMYTTEMDAISRMVKEIMEDHLDEAGGIKQSIGPKVDELKMLMLDLTVKLPNTKEAVPVRQALANYSRIIHPIVVMTQAAGYFHRLEPAVFTLVGHPKAGKTFVFDHIIDHIIVPQMGLQELADFERNRGACKYSHPVGAKHEDCYNGQLVSIFNDAFASTDMAGSESEASFLINAIGTNEFKLPQAIAEKKGNVKFTSKFVFVNSNITHIKDNDERFKSIRTASALRRRLDEFCYYVAVKPQYWSDHWIRESAGKSKDWKLTHCQIDPIKAAADADPITGLNYDAYELYPWSLEYDIPLSDVALSVDQLIEIGVQYSRRKLQRGADKLAGDRKIAISIVERRRQELLQQGQIRPQVSLATSLTGYDTPEEFPLSDLEADDFTDNTKVHLDQASGVHTPFSVLKRIRRVHRLCDVSIRRNKSEVPLMLKLDERIPLKCFVREYLRYCLSTAEAERIPLVIYEEELKAEGIELPVLHALLESVSLKDLQDFVDWDVTDEVLLLCIRARRYMTSAADTVLCVSRHYANSMRNSLNVMIEQPWKWFLNYPVVGGFLVGAAISFSSFIVISKVLEWIAASCDSDPINEVEVSKGGAEVQACMQAKTRTPEDESFISARLENCYNVVVQRERVVNGESIKERGSVCVLWFLGGREAVTVWHLLPYIDFFKKYEGTVQVKIGLSPFLKGSQEPLHWFNPGDLIFDESQKAQDRVFITFPSIRMHTNLTNFFPSKKDKVFMEYVASPDQRLGVTFIKRAKNFVNMCDTTVHRGGSNVVYPVQYEAYDKYTERSVMSDPTKTMVMKHEVVMCLDMLTEFGDCGAFAFLTGIERFRFAADHPRYQQPVIVYSHHSGGGAGYGYGGLLYQEDFAHVISRIKSNIKPTKEKVVSGFIELCSRFELVPPEISTCFKTTRDFADHHNVLAQLPSLGYNPRSAIERSPLYGLFPRTRVPAKLFDHYRDGIYIPVMENSRFHYGSNTSACLPERKLQFVIDHVTSRILTVSSLIWSRRVLTIEQAIMGDTASHLPALDRSTSPGPLLNFIRKELKVLGSGKHWIFGAGPVISLDGKYARALIQCVEDQVRDCLDGDKPFDLFGDNLKDELREIEKTSSPRLFCSGHLPTLINMRRYFGDFAGWIYENRVKNGIAIGINPYSREWDALYMKLVSNSNDGVFGDFGKFDKKMVLSLLYATLGLARKYYGECDEKANLVREMLFETVVVSIHAAPDGMKTTLYEWLHGNTSGNFLTAIINSVANLCICMFVFCSIHLEHLGKDIETCQFSELPFELMDERTSVVVYGDDNASTIRDLPHIDFYSMQKHIQKYFGMEYTDELKGKNGLVAPYRPVIEGNFIARGFVPSCVLGMTKVLAPLKMRSILEMFQWYKRRVDEKELVRVVEVALRELSLHGEAEFKKYAPLIVSRCHDKLKRYPHYSSWEVALFAVSESSGVMYCNVTELPDVAEGILKEFTPRDDRNGDHLEFIPSGLDRNAVLGFVNCMQKVYNLNNSSSPSIVGEAPRDGEKKSVSYIHAVRQSSDATHRIDGGGLAASVVDSTVICDSSRTTCWTEDAGKKESTYLTPSMPHRLDVQREGIEDFLGKPYLLSQVAYSTGTSANSNLYSTSVASLLTSVTQWNNKLIGFNLVRGTFVVRVEVNAYPFQAGRMLLHYLPNTDVNLTANPGFELTYNQLLVSKFQHPYIELDLRDTVAELEIPYISPVPFYPLKESVFDWGKVYLDAIVSLRTGSAGLTSAEVSIYGYWKNVEIAAPAVPQSSNRVTRVGDREQKERGPISKGLMSVSKAAGSLAEIPFLSAVMQPASWIARVSSGLASAFGWSKPRLESPPNIVLRNGLHYAGVAEGADIGRSTGVSFDNKLTVRDDFSITKEDEMSMKFLLSIPTYMSTVNWASGTAHGTNILSRQISPYNMYSLASQTKSTHVMTYFQGAPLFYLSNFFKFWRGDMKLILKFVKTQYHSGRLQITWTPVTTVGTAPSLTTSLYSLRQIVDIRDQDMIELTLPYMAFAPYLNTDVVSTPYWYSGQLDVVVLNDLKAPETCASSIDILEFYVPGENFEFQCPGPNLLPTEVFYPQSNLATTLVEQVIADRPKSSVDTFNSSNCVGEHVMSIKQLLSRFSQLTVHSDQINTKNNFIINPYFVAGVALGVGGSPITPSLGGDLFSFLAPMYNFMRGGVRLAVITEGGTTHINSCNIPGAYIQGNSYDVVAPNIVNNGTGTYPAFNYVTTGLNKLTPVQPAIANDLGVGYSVVDLPYYSMFPVSLMPTNVGNSGQNTLGSQNTASLFPQTTASFSSTTAFTAAYQVYRSVQDDFQLSFFIGCPPLPYSYA